MLKKLLSFKHRDLHQHHHYQLTVIFLFAFGAFLFLPYYLIMKEFELNLLDWQWYFFWPWLIFYVIYCLKQRSKIPNGERIAPLKRPIIHWILLGLTVIATQLQPNDLEKMKSIEIAFVIFSLFVADSYWDFTADLLHRFHR